MCVRDFLDIRIPRIILSFLGQFRYPYIEVTLYYQIERNVVAPQYVRARLWYSAESNKLSPTGGHAAAQALSACPLASAGRNVSRGPYPSICQPHHESTYG